MRGIPKSLHLKEFYNWLQKFQFLKGDMHSVSCQILN